MSSEPKPSSPDPASPLGGCQQGSPALFCRKFAPTPPQVARIIKAALTFSARSSSSLAESAGRDKPRHEAYSHHPFAHSEPLPERVSGAGAGAGLASSAVGPGHLSPHRPLPQHRHRPRADPPRPQLDRPFRCVAQRSTPPIHRFHGLFHPHMAPPPRLGPGGRDRKRNLRTSHST